MSTSKIQEAPDGHLLVLNAEGLLEIAGSEVVLHPELARQLGVKDNEIFDVLKDRHGNTWYCTGRGIMRESSGRIEKPETNGPTGHAATHAYEDAQGNVWIGTENGLFRATATGLELVADEINVTLALQRSRRQPVGWYQWRWTISISRSWHSNVHEKDGLPNEVIMTVITTHDGAFRT